METTNPTSEKHKAIPQESIMESEARRLRTDAILQSIVRETSNVTGDEFLQTFVRVLATTLKFNWALIGEVNDSRDSVRTLALWAGGQFADNIEYALKGTPCDQVVGKAMCHYQSGVQKLFPEDPLLAEMGAESYIGMPIFGPAGEPIGILAALNDKPIDNVSDARLILSIFAARAGIELKRKKFEDKLKKANEELESRVIERTADLIDSNKILKEQIMERRRAEEALHQSEEMYRMLAESAHDFIYILDTDLCVLYANSSAAGFLGLTQPDITGKPLKDVLPQGLDETTEKTLKEALISGKPSFFEKNYKVGDKEIWLGTKLNPMSGNDGKITSLLGISRDITERMKYTREIKKERDLAQKYLDVAGVIIVIVDSGQKVILINKKGVDILGYDEDEIIGRNWFDTFLPESVREAVRKSFMDAISGKKPLPGRFENLVLAKSGEEKVIEWKNTLLKDEHGNVTASLSSGEDITVRKRTEEERERLIAELKDALSNIKTLKGLLPICASCKKIRDDKGYWKKIEIYIQEHSEADFSHGICPDCAKKLVL